MKILFGKEIVTKGLFNEKEHKICLEDDNEYIHLKIQPQLFCLIPKYDILKIIKFIRDVQILGVDNEAVKLMHKLKDELIQKLRDELIIKGHKHDNNIIIYY